MHRLLFIDIIYKKRDGTNTCREIKGLKKVDAFFGCVFPAGARNTIDSW
jgi:hypothetical protein